MPCKLSEKTKFSIVNLYFTYYPLPNKRTGTIGKKLLRLGGGLAWVQSKKLQHISGGTFIKGGMFLKSLFVWNNLLRKCSQK